LIDVENIQLTLTCFKGLDGRAAYILYQTMRVWLERREISHRFDWINTGNYIPDYITLDRESAVAFRLVFDI
jgi:hypothetical protein